MEDDKVQKEFGLRVRNFTKKERKKEPKIERKRSYLKSSVTCKDLKSERKRVDKQKKSKIRKRREACSHST
jgi:hypothetical protein